MFRKASIFVASFAVVLVAGVAFAQIGMFPSLEDRREPTTNDEPIERPAVVRVEEPAEGPAAEESAEKAADPPKEADSSAWIEILYPEPG